MANMANGTVVSCRVAICGGSAWPYVYGRRVVAEQSYVKSQRVVAEWLYVEGWSVVPR